MQTTHFSVMSTVNDHYRMDDIRDFINSGDDSCSVIDMCTAIVEEPGNYDDVVVSKDPPFLFCDEPMLPIPRAVEGAIRSKAFHIACLVIVLIAAPMFPGSLLLPAAYRTGSFVISTSLQIIVFGMHLLMFRRRVINRILGVFDFWYLTVFQFGACLCGVFIYVSAGVPVAVAIVFLALYWVFHSLFAFGIDASPWSPTIRGLFMSFWFVTYAIIALAARFAEYIFERDVYYGFVTYDVDFYFARFTPRSGMVTTIITLLAFYAKYAYWMLRGREYVMLYFEVANVHRAAGAITVTEEDVPDDSPPRLNVTGESDAPVATEVDAVTTVITTDEMQLVDRTSGAPAKRHRRRMTVKLAHDAHAKLVMSGHERLRVSDGSRFTPQYLRDMDDKKHRSTPRGSMAASSNTAGGAVDPSSHMSESTGSWGLRTAAAGSSALLAMTRLQSVGAVSNISLGDTARSLRAPVAASFEQTTSPPAGTVERRSIVNFLGAVTVASADYTPPGDAKPN